MISNPSEVGISMSVPTRAAAIAEESFAQLLGTRLLSEEKDRVVVEMPYGEHLGVGRVHGGAISALVDIAATAAFWSDPELTLSARGATVDFTIHFLRLAIGEDLTAEATVRRRGGTLCTGDVIVRSAAGEEMAIARVTYKLSR
jgi:uncharacterized protein (TIGR00369 family)